MKYVGVITRGRGRDRVIWGIYYNHESAWLMTKQLNASSYDEQYYCTLVYVEDSEQTKE